MHQVWFKGHRDNEEARKKQVLAFSEAFRELKEVLETLRESPTSDYGKTDWPLHMADVNGANRKLEQIINLIDLDEKG